MNRFFVLGVIALLLLAVLARIPVVVPGYSVTIVEKYSLEDEVNDWLSIAVGDYDNVSNYWTFVSNGTADGHGYSVEDLNGNGDKEIHLLDDEISYASGWRLRSKISLSGITALSMNYSIWVKNEDTNMETTNIVKLYIISNSTNIPAVNITVPTSGQWFSGSSEVAGIGIAHEFTIDLCCLKHHSGYDEEVYFEKLSVTLLEGYVYFNGTSFDHVELYNASTGSLIAEADVNASNVATIVAQRGNYTVKIYSDGSLIGEQTLFIRPGSIYEISVISTSNDISLSLETDKLTYSPGESIIVTATLLNNSVPLPGYTIVFHFNGIDKVATTNSSGMASVTFPAPNNDGTYTIEAEVLELSITDTRDIVVISPSIWIFDKIRDFFSDIWSRIKFWEHTWATANLTIYIANNPGVDYKIYVFIPRSFMPDKCITREISSLNSTVEVKFENLPANSTVKIKVVARDYWVEEEVKLENPENSITIDYSNIAKELGFWDKVKLWIYEHLFRW